MATAKVLISISYHDNDHQDIVIIIDYHLLSNYHVSDAMMQTILQIQFHLALISHCFLPLSGTCG